MDDVHCTGHESRLSDCQFLDWGDGNCNHFEDVGVRCRYDVGKKRAVGQI